MTDRWPLADTAAEEIFDRWQNILVDRELNDMWLAERAPQDMASRMTMQRVDLDGALVTGGGSLKTFLKNLTHARHAGLRPMLQVRSPSAPRCCCQRLLLPTDGPAACVPAGRSSATYMHVPTTTE
eukprot:COSAG06_NODE_8890_length_2039_cov_1.551031_2_plen_126_part_00